MGKESHMKIMVGRDKLKKKHLESQDLKGIPSTRRSVWVKKTLLSFFYCSFPSSKIVAVIASTHRLVSV